MFVYELQSCRDHIKMQEEITLMLEGRKDETCSPSFHQSLMEEDTSHLGDSSVHATCNNNNLMSATTAEMVASTLRNSKNLDKSMEKFRSNRFSLEDCLPPMIFDEAEERADPCRVFHEYSQTDRVHMTPPNSPIISGAGANTEFSNLTGLQNEKVQIISPKIPVSLYVSIDATPESKVANSPGARTPGLMAVGTPATKEGARVSKKRKCLYYANEIVTSNEVYKAGLNYPDKGARVSKKCKCLYDADVIVITNEVYKAGLDDPSALVKKRKKTALFNNANQMSEKVFFQPLIPGVSINFSLLCEKEQKSPVKIETTRTRTKSHEIGSLSSHETFGEISIAPSWHVTNSVSQRGNNTCGSTNSERPGCARSFASVDREPSAVGVPKYDVSSMSFDSVDGELSPVQDQEVDESLMTKEEEINFCKGDDKQENYHWSTRTRAVARFLHTEFLDKKKRGENEVVKLSQAVQGKSKKRNARLFYELLALTTRGFLNVKQDKPYGDISIVETSKLKESLEADKRGR
ncbi:hypothetical protein AgCh_030687 [Apium graveolens]